MDIFDLPPEDYNRIMIKAQYLIERGYTDLLDVIAVANNILNSEIVEKNKRTTENNIK